MGTYPIGLAGESFRNNDGTDRQAEIRRCRVGEAVELEREPDNPYDSNCVKVISARGVQIGNIPRDAAWIAERLDRGTSISAAIRSINTGGRGSLGVVLDVCTEVIGSA